MENTRRLILVQSALAFVFLGCASGSSTSDGTGSLPGGTTTPGSSTPSPSGTATTTGTMGGGPTEGAPEISPSEVLSGGTIGAGGSTGTGGVTGSGGTTAAAGAAAPPVGAAGSTGAVVQQNPQAAELTAGTWDDNLNFDFYQQYLATMNATQNPGLPLIDRAGRLEITATDGAGKPLAGARVTVGDAGGKLFSSTTRGDGKLFFFPGTVGATTGTALEVAISYGGQSATASAHVGDAKLDVALPAAAALPAPTLDLALVVDTTGSMGDELSYLTAEMTSILTRVAAEFPNVSQRWALVFYRDTDMGDEYVVRSFNFTTSLDSVRAHLAAQSAGGGGDTPESPDKALASLTTLSWRADSVARMAFWIADAPHHDAQASVMAQDFLRAAGMSIRLYPIAASGADELLEYTMRTGAEVTGGRYLFLTNDSGIGNDHKEPTIPCYVVTTLDKAMERMIDMELLGTDAQPAPPDIIRTSGNPQGGRCTTGSGQTVTIL